MGSSNNSQTYPGSQDQGTTASEYNAHDFHIMQRIGEIGTATIVEVTKAPYDANGNALTPGSAAPVGFVDVKPLVNQVNGDNQATPHETVFRLSYFRYEGGYGAFISDPKVGDQGKMVVADHDTSGVKSQKAAANPGSGRRFSYADGTYFGLTQSKTAPTQWFAWLSKGFNVTDAYGNTMIGTQNGVVINGCLIKQNGDVVTKHGTSLDTHVNTLVTTGSGNSGPPP